MSRATVMTIVLLVVLAGGALVVHREFRTAQARPSVQRLDSQSRLRQFAAAIASYRQRHQAWPDTLFQVMKHGGLRFGANIVPGAGPYRYRAPPPESGRDAVVMWTDGLHAGARAGDPWGAEGERTQLGIPAAGYVLNAALEVEEVSAEEHRRRVPAPAPASP